jgi:predicted transcriptional regulator
MLINLISLLSKNKVYLEATLVDKLGVDQTMVGQLIHELIYRGYVEKTYVPVDAGRCNHCTSQCIPKNAAENQFIAWSLTEKGKALVKKNNQILSSNT